MDGAEATAAIRAAYPDTQVVVLTTYADDPSIIAALSAGATGYLTKDATRDDIRRALEAAAAGQVSLTRRAGPAVGAARAGAQAGCSARAAPVPRPDGLTEREAEVLA